MFSAGYTALGSLVVFYMQIMEGRVGNSGFPLAGLLIYGLALLTICSLTRVINRVFQP